MSSLTGYLRYNTNGQYSLETEDGMYLVTFLVPERAEETPINQLIVLETERHDDKSVLVPDVVPWYQQINLAAPPPDDVTVGLWRKAPSDADQDEIDAALNRVLSAAFELDRFWRHYLCRWKHQRFTLDVRGFVLPSDCNSQPIEYCSTAIRNAIAEGKTDDWEPWYRQVWGGWHDTACGHGQIGGRYSVTYANCGINTMRHELGHSLHLGHSNRIEPDGNSIEYGESTIMGKRTGGHGLNAPHMWKLGLETEREAPYVLSAIQERPQTYVLAPIECHPDVIPEEVIQCARFDKFYVSIRKDKGWPFTHYANLAGGLYIHSTDRRVSTFWQYPILRVGETRAVTGYQGQYEVKYLEYLPEREMARVRIRLVGDAQTPIQEPFPESTFRNRIPSAGLTEAHNGLWYDPQFDGQGLDLQIYNNHLQVYWYTFNEHTNDRRYYVGAAALPDEGPVEVEMFSTRNGTWNEPERREEYYAGKAQLYYLPGKGLTFHAQTVEHGYVTIECEENNLIPNNNPHSGAYFDPQHPGAGLSLQINDDGLSTAAVLYSYGPRDNTPPLNRETTQRWWILSGVLSDLTPTADGYEMVMQQVTNGRFLDYQRNSQTDVEMSEEKRREPVYEDVAQAQLFVRDGEIELEIQWNDDTTDTLEMVRVTP